MTRVILAFFFKVDFLSEHAAEYPSIYEQTQDLLTTTETYTTNLVLL
jgi:hypothetical protein